MSGIEVITQQTGPNQVVHSRQDSTHELDHLFQASLSTKPEALGNTWSTKNMPASFFNPQVRTHSRDPSIDGSQSGDTKPPTFGAHARNRSCPVIMDSGLSVPTSGSGNTNNARHARHNSLDVLDERTSLEYVPLPAGWERAFTPEGKAYFIDHNNQNTSWVDPRKQYINHIRQPSQPQLSMTVAEALARPLPQGWERSVNANSEVYFIDHERKRTDWYDPRVPKHIQLLGGRLKPDINVNAFLHQYAQNATPQQSPMPQPMTPHQRMPSNEQLNSPAHQRMASGGSADLNPRMSPADYHQLQMQEELVRQNMIRQQSMENMETSQHSPGDPFVGSQAPGSFPSPQPNAETNGAMRHVKQASVDSGLGGMSQNFGMSSMPHLSASTGALTGVGSHDTSCLFDQDMEGVRRPPQHMHGQHHNQLPTGLVNNNNNEMDADTDDIVPSIPADLNNELINEALLSNRMDLTWL